MASPSNANIVSADLVHVRQLKLVDIGYSQYERIRQCISSDPEVLSELSLNLSLIQSCGLQSIWHSLQLRHSQRLKITAVASDNLVRLSITDIDVAFDCYALDDDEFALQVMDGYMQKLYGPWASQMFSGPEVSISEDLIRDASVYAVQVDVVALEADDVTSGLNEHSSLFIIAWLQVLVRPSVLVIDTRLSILVENIHRFLWTSLRSIIVHFDVKRFGRHRFAPEPDDQVVLDGIADWLKQVDLVGTIEV
ncbi:hypothetical protein PENSPDRAFT_672784, partial [Peniophora sp. CONT]